MSKSNGTRPVKPCWNCGSDDVALAAAVVQPGYKFGDTRDNGWFACLMCGATAQENPTKRGPGVKVEPSGAATQLSRRWRKR